MTGSTVRSGYKHAVMTAGDDRRHLPEEPQGRLQAHQLLLLRDLEDVAQVDAGPDEEGRPEGALGARVAGRAAPRPLLGGTGGAHRLTDCSKHF